MNTKEPNKVSLDMFDTKTKADAGVDVEINRADGEPSGLTITVLGTDSATYQKLREKQDRARVRIMAKGGRNSMETVFDSAKQNDIELVTACTLSWKHADGDMPFGADDKDSLAEFYAKYPLVLDQVRSAMNDRSLFTRV